MDFSQISTEDLKAISKKDWANVSTPGLQAYQAQLQHESQAQQQSLNPQKIPDAADKAFQGNKDSAQPVSNQPDSPLKQYLQKGLSAFSALQGGLVKGATLGNLDPSKLPLDINRSAMQENPGLTKGAELAGGVATGSMLGSLSGPAASAMGRIAQNAGTGAALGGLAKPAEGGDRISNAVTGGLVGGGTSAVLEGASSLAGKLGDYLMQKSVGMKKYYPGTGTQLADLGVVGTKNMMANQVEDKLAQEEGKLQDVVKNLSGTVNSKEIADAVSQKANQFTLPSSGQPSPFSEAELNKVRGLSDQLSQMGDLSASDLLALKRQGDYQGFTASGNPSTSTEAELGRVGANAARTALKKMSPDAADHLLNEQALIRANKTLSKPEAIHSGVGSSLFFGKIPGQSLFGSLGGQAAVKGSQAVDKLADPAVLQALIGATQSSK